GPGSESGGRRNGGESFVEEFVAPAEQQVAEQDGRGSTVAVPVSVPPGRAVQGLEAPVRCGCAAPGIGVVDDVVVDERGRVEDLERAGEGDHCLEPVLGVVRRARDAVPAPITKARSKALPTAEKLPREGRERLEVSSHLGENGFTRTQEIVDPR